MKNIIIAIITSMFLFLVSAGASFYLNRLPDQTPNDVQLNNENELNSATQPDEEPMAKPMAAQLPVGGRADQALTIEAVLQLSESARLRQEKLDTFESELKKESRRIKLLFEDLKREKAELATFNNGVEGKIRALDEMANQLAEVLSKIGTEKAELEELKKNAGVEHDKSDEMQNRVKQIKGWFSGLEPKQAADILIEKANGGDLEFAAALLHSLPDRQKAKILPAINDSVLVNQLIDSLRIQPEKKAN